MLETNGENGVPVFITSLNGEGSTYRKGTRAQVELVSVDQESLMENRCRTDAGAVGTVATG